MDFIDPKTYLYVYLFAGPLYAAYVLITSYGAEWIASYYEAHVPRVNWPNWVFAHTSSPERSKRGILWIFALILAIPVLNLYFVYLAILNWWQFGRRRSSSYK